MQLIKKASLPEPVSNNAVVEGFIGNMPYIYTFGGIDSTKVYSGIHLRSYRYNIEADAWEQIPDLPDTLGKVAASASRVKGVIYIIGGYHVFPDGHELSSDKVHRYDITTNTYLEDGSPIPVAIDDQVQAVWRDSLIYVVTGWSDKHNVPNVQVYNPSDDKWQVGSPVPDNLQFNSFGASGTIIGDTIYYFGGARFERNYPIQNNLRVGVINPTNPTEISWSQSIPDSTVAGYRMAAHQYRNEPIWIGGSEITYNYNGISYLTKEGVPPANRIVRYDVDKKQWFSYDYQLPMDLRGLGMVPGEAATHYYLVGGMRENQAVSAELVVISAQLVQATK